MDMASRGIRQSGFWHIFSSFSFFPILYLEAGHACMHHFVFVFLPFFGRGRVELHALFVGAETGLYVRVR